LADTNTIEIETADGSTESLPYDVLVIATGGALSAPWRAEADKLASLEDRAKECEEFRMKV
jgi:NADH dehydrogenase FAD-containing subunit